MKLELHERSIYCIFLVQGSIFTGVYHACSQLYINSPDSPPPTVHYTATQNHKTSREENLHFIFILFMPYGRIFSWKYSREYLIQICKEPGTPFFIPCLFAYNICMEPDQNYNSFQTVRAEGGSPEILK